MASALALIQPYFVPPLYPDFRPAVLANRAFQKEVADSKVGVPLVLGLERANGELSRFETYVFPSGHPRAAANLMYVERRSAAFLKIVSAKSKTSSCTFKKNWVSC